MTALSTNTSKKALIGQLAENLLVNNLMVAVAESCTGGMLAQEFTALEASSKWFECGFVTYSNASKIRLLGVDANVLSKYGAVSSQVAEQMALGSLAHSAAKISASITGIAGPSGGTAKKPVGTVYIGTARAGQSAKSVLHQFHGDRQSIREQTVLAAITQLLEELNG